MIELNKSESSKKEDEDEFDVGAGEEDLKPEEEMFEDEELDEE